MSKRQTPKRMPPEGVAEFERIYRDKAIAHAQVGIGFMQQTSPDRFDLIAKAAECFAEAAKYAGMVDLLGEIKYHMIYDDDEVDTD